jgi:phosphoserine phosphatase RsbU/P
VAIFRDWLDLGASTIRSLSTDEIANLYSRDWTETRKALLAEHENEIARDRRRLRRWLRTTSAMFHGIAKRLSPMRRIVFLIAFVWFFFAIFRYFGRVDELNLSTLANVAGAFLVMVVLLAMELIDKLRFRDELTLARDLQATLIPKHPPKTADYDVAAFNHIANTVGGDLYDFIPLADGRMAVLFGDASGHGMAAGLVMAVAHAAFRTQLDVDPSPQAIIGSLNRILCRTGGSRSFFACCYVILSPDGSFNATVAGHPPILKIDAAGRVVDHIGRGAYPLGIKTSLSWDEQRGSLAPGERLLFHSDGLPESRDINDREFGDAAVEIIAVRFGALPAESLLQALVDEWRRFTDRRPAEDDVSIAVIVKK